MFWLAVGDACCDAEEVATCAVWEPAVDVKAVVADAASSRLSGTPC